MLPSQDMNGVLLLAGHCDAFPTASYDEIMADAANGFAQRWNHAASRLFGASLLWPMQPI